MKKAYLIPLIVGFLLQENNINAEDGWTVLSCWNHSSFIQVSSPPCNNLKDFKHLNKTPSFYKQDPVCIHSYVSFLENGSYGIHYSYMFDTQYYNNSNGEEEIVGSFRAGLIPSQIDKTDNSFICKNESN